MSLRPNRHTLALGAITKPAVHHWLTPAFSNWGMPLWIAVVGAFVAIVITKQLFGGLGYNFANPALVGRIVLFLGFTSRMTAYVYPDMAVDALASATPLAVADKTTLPLLDVFLGFHGGMIHLMRRFFMARLVRKVQE